MNKHQLYSIFLLSLSQLCVAYKILVVFPLPGRSHNILGEGVVRHLLNAGHDITFITHFPKEKVPDRLKQIDCSSDISPMPGNSTNIKMILDGKVSIGNPLVFFDLINKLCKTIMNQDNVQNLLRDSKEKFDLVITEWMFGEVYSGLGAFYDCPFIWVSTVEPHWMVLELIDELTNPSYVPNAISTAIPPYSFKQRVIEFLMQSVAYLTKQWYFTNQDEKLYESIFKPLFDKQNRILPRYTEVKYNTSLILGNSHVSLGQATSLPQSYKAVGGYHIDTDLKPLSEDLKKIFEKSKHGVIYFSMGSNLKSKDMPEELKSGLLKMFGTLKYTVLWKFEESLKDLPKNVHILQWAPQTSILAHPKCVLFITHGGLLSTIETVHFGKPIIGIPVFGDQFNNVQRAVKRGFAKMVTIAYDMADELKAAIEEILSDTKYAEKAKELSLIYHDRPTLPGKELVHWVEHVVRTRGATHLRSPALHVAFYQKFYIDFFSLVIFVLFVFYKAIKKIIKYVFNKNSKQIVIKNKKNK